jgi:hypothetical protein
MAAASWTGAGYAPHQLITTDSINFASEEILLEGFYRATAATSEEGYFFVLVKEAVPSEPIEMASLCSLSELTTTGLTS